MWTLYGNLVSSVICTKEAEIRARRLQLKQKDIKYGSKHFIINIAQKGAVTYNLCKYKDIVKSSQLLNRKIEEERLILEVSTLYKSEQIVDRHQHIEKLMPSTPSELYAITLDNMYFKKNHVNSLIQKKGKTILTYFTKTWADSICSVEQIDKEERQYILNEKSLEISPLQLSLLLVPSLNLDSNLVRT